MNTLIIYTHPNRKSLSSSFLEKTVEGLKENKGKKEIKVLDLYAENFNPLLVFNDEKRRRDMHTDPVLEEYRQQLLWATQIVLIYPIWWGRPPAMLMGYIDQMFASNFAYKDNGGLMPEGLLRGRSVVCISTMKGPANYPLFFLNNAHKALMKRGLFNFIGIKKVKFFEFGNMESPKGKQEDKLNKVYRYFKEQMV